MNRLKIRMLEIGVLMVLLYLLCTSAKTYEPENNQDMVSAQNIEINEQRQYEGQEYTEESRKAKRVDKTEESELESISSRVQDNAGAMNKDEINSYMFDTDLHSNMSQKTSFKFLILKELEAYFPNLENEVWEIIEKEDDDYIAKFYVNRIDIPRDKCAYTGKLLLHPNFTITILDDTIEPHPENGFCAYATGEIYAYQGCYIEECTGSYLDMQNNNRLDVSFPIYYTKDNEWRNFNSNIWEGLENWFVNETADDSDVSITLDYEIRACSDYLFSILFYGQCEKKGQKEDISMGLTVSVLSEKLLSKSMFVRGEDKEAFYDYYVEDGILYSINQGKDGWEYTNIGNVEMAYYELEREERNLYNKNGCWLGDCYYEVPVIGTVPEEYKKVSQYMRKDLGKFFTETAVVFENIVNSFVAAEQEYVSEYDWLPGGYHCYVETEITYNNEGILEITYRYNVLQIIGEAVAVYDLNTGTVVEHQEWQDDMIQQLHDKKYR